MPGRAARALLVTPCPRARLLRDRLADQPALGLTVVLDAADAGDWPVRRTETRRDQPRCLRRWQFDLRREAVLAVGRQ